jgi:hypothetical protein
MVTEEDAAKHAGLPQEQRFYLTERLARERLANARKEAGPNDWPEYDEFDYMIEIMAAAEAFGIGELGGWELPSKSDDNASAICRNFRGQATKVSQKLMFRYAGVSPRDPNTVALDAATKERLRFHLGQVRELSNLSARSTRHELGSALSSTCWVRHGMVRSVRLTPSGR